MMTTRGKIILIAVIAILGTVGIVATSIILNPAPKPADVDITPEETSEQNQQEKKPTEQSEDQSHTDAEGEPLPETTEDAIMKNATLAAEAYVSQPADEEPAARETRLNRYFAPGSPVVKADPPQTSPSYSTSRVTTLESSWYSLNKKNAIGVIVYLIVSVNTGFDAHNEYQTWVVELTQHNGRWLSDNITKSDLPYIQGVD